MLRALSSLSVGRSACVRCMCSGSSFNALPGKTCCEIIVGDSCTFLLLTQRAIPSWTNEGAIPVVASELFFVFFLLQGNYRPFGQTKSTSPFHCKGRRRRRERRSTSPFSYLGLMEVVPKGTKCPHNKDSVSVLLYVGPDGVHTRCVRCLCVRSLRFWCILIFLLCVKVAGALLLFSIMTDTNIIRGKEKKRGPTPPAQTPLQPKGLASLNSYWELCELLWAVFR
jgi:hypothetical protein